MLQEDASYKALSTLHKLCAIPHYEDDKFRPQLVPQSPTGNSYTVIYDLHQITCHHNEELPADSLAYGMCHSRIHGHVLESHTWMYHIPSKTQNTALQ